MSQTTLPSIFVLVHKDILADYTTHLSNHFKYVANCYTQHSPIAGKEHIAANKEWIDQSKLVLCLVHADWLGGEYIQELWEYAQQQSKDIIPIYWESCLDLEANFSGIAALPSSEEPFMNPNANQSEIARSIAIKIKELLGTVSNAGIAAGDISHREQTIDLFRRDILGVRASKHEHGFYFEREHDAQLRECLAQKKNCLVEGNPMSGKTCSVFEAIYRIEYPFELYCMPLPQADQRHAELPKPKKGYQLIVFFDDLNKYAQKSADLTSDTLKRLLLQKDTTIVATCRTGREYTEYQNLDEQCRQELRHIAIPKLSSDKVEDFESKAQIYHQDHPDFQIPAPIEAFDGNIGSFFLDLTPIRKRYEYIKEQQYDNPTSWVAMQILNAIYIFYTTGNFERSNTYSSKNLQDFCLLHQEKLPDGTPQPQQLIRTKWMAAIKLINAEKTHHNFIRETIENSPSGIQSCLQVEEAYVEKIFSYIEPTRVYMLILQLYTTLQEAIAAGFYAQLIALNIKMHQAPDLTTALELFNDARKKRIKPDQISYNILIDKSETWSQAKQAFDNMKRNGLTPDKISYSTLIDKSETFQQAKQTFDGMKQNELLPDEISYNTLINKSETFQQAKQVFDDMKQNGLIPNKKSYNTLINKSKTWSQAKQTFDDITLNGLMPNEISYSTLIKKSETFQQAKQVFDDMKQNGLMPNEITYSTLIKKSETFQQAKQAFDDMEQNGLTPNEITYSTLIDKIEALEQAELYYAQFIQKFPYRKGNARSEKDYNYLFAAMFKKIRTAQQWQWMQSEIKRLDVPLDSYAHKLYNSLSARFSC